jgi:hypothetical protein
MADNTLTVSAPDGAHWDFDEVKTAKGENSLGNVPLLTWDDPQKAIEFYGADGVTAILNGTSVRVTAQGIARRLRAAGKTDDEIAQAQVEHRPGTRQTAAATPVSRARRAAEGAAEALGDSADVIAQLLERVKRGEISAADLAALAGAQG